jgi:cytochrome P450
MAFLNILYSTCAAIAAYNLWKVVKSALRTRSSRLWQLQGPSSESWLYGNFRQLGQDAGGALQAEWVQKYGQTFRFNGLFNVRGDIRLYRNGLIPTGFTQSNRLFTIDHRAINHILTHSFEYQKPAQGRYNLSRIVGEGVLITEGETHRKQRRVMNPGFGPVQVRELTGIFIEKANQLRDTWLAETRKVDGDGPTRIDALSWLSRTTLDIIGLAGASHRPNSDKFLMSCERFRLSFWLA